MPLPYAETLDVHGSVRLRALRAEDEPALTRAIRAAGSELDRWLPYLVEIARDGHVGAYLAGRVDDRITDRSAEWGVWRADELVGCVNLNSIELGNQRADVGYWLTEEARGSGIAVRATHRLLAHAFDDLGFHRVGCVCITGNLASRAVATRLGMVEEWTQRDRWKVHGSFVDAVGYRLLEQEWRARQA